MQAFLQLQGYHLFAAPADSGDNTMQCPWPRPRLSNATLHLSGNSIITGGKRECEFLSHNPCDLTRDSALKVKPNAAHRALAEFSLSSIRSRHAPNSTFTLISQNVDGLSVVALDDVLASNPSEPEEQQPRILEMHGRLFDVKCSSKRCDHIQFDRSSPICEGLRGVEELVDKHSMDPDIPKTELPRCAKCHALARPGVVWFEEMPLYLDVIDKLVDEADLCLVVGTSSTVRFYFARVLSC